MSTSLTSSSYHRLVSDLTAILQQGQQQALKAVNQIRLKTYWVMGKRLARSKELAQEASADTFFKRLAADLKIEPSLLYRIHQFYRLWPKAVPSIGDSGQISWSHVVELLSIKNEKERSFYLKSASTEGWSRDTLRKAIEHEFFHSRNKPKRLKGKTLKRPDNPLHVYKAVVEKVVDGDTLLARIDLGFDVWISSRTRFRGINTSELIKNGLPAGNVPDRAEEARQFVERRLAGVEFIVIKTYKTDMYGRYVVDVFYSPVIKEKEAVYEKGFFLNADLLKAGLADLML